MISAMAGCGKTSTLVMLANEASSERFALALAFNVKTKAELERRFPSNFTVKTLNGLGHSAWARFLGRNPEVSDRKLGQLISSLARTQHLDLPGDTWHGVKALVTSAMNAGLVPSVFPVKHPMMTDTMANWASISEDNYLDLEEPFLSFARSVLIASVKLGFGTGTSPCISYDDQIYLPTCYGAPFPSFPLVLVDEAQDLSPLQHEMVKRAAKDRLIVVGDPRQCHPPGTMISLTGGDTVAIEDIRVGQQLISYNRKIGFSGITTQGTLVKDKKSFPFDGELIRIATQLGVSHECTPEHKCMVRFSERTGYCVYLMQKGPYFRIGTAQLNYDDNSFGPSMRARQEGADAYWILFTAETKEEALIAEKVVWTNYGLPDMIFKESGKASSTQRHLDSAWAQIGENSSRAKRCLRDHKKLFELPFWRKDGARSHFGVSKTFIIPAVNLISDFMEVQVLKDGNTGEWSQFYTEHVPYKGPVYGIEVGGNGYGLHLYTANYIVTHNSIYGFRGADYHSMTKMRKLRETWIDLPLTLTFRCPKAVVALQPAPCPRFHGGGE